MWMMQIAMDEKTNAALNCEIYSVDTARLGQNALCVQQLSGS